MTLLTWKANYSETDHENNTFESEELINLKHYGTFFEATGNIKGKYPRVFNYTGKVYNNLLWGFYQKENTEPGSLEGKGVFLIKVNDEKDKMNGYCAFHDKDSGRIEKSEYAWEKIK